MISVYMPHSRYDRSHGIGYLESIYDRVHGLLYEAKRLHYRIVVGGDLNTTLASNRRADLMIDLMHAFDSAISDDPLVNANALSWTHSHLLYGNNKLISFLTRTISLSMSAMHLIY